MEKINSINYWKYYLLLLLLLAITFNFGIFSNSLKYTSNTEESLDKKTELFDLKNSGPQINITTPENKTYTRPMTGYYPATYGFENDDINSTPEEWSDLSDPSTSATIIASQSGHNKVLKLQDSSGSGWAQMYQIFNDGGKQSGTVELIVRKNFDSGESGICIQLLDITQAVMYIYADASNDGRFILYNGTENEFSPGLYSDDTWFHIRFDFETGMGGYQGLNPDTFDLYINGVKRLSDNLFWNPTTEVTRLNLFTQNMNTGSWYADAIGYSWDPNYNIGDNLNEGLLLSYENSTSLDWIGYSLDNQANKTILGNTTIPMPENGFHSIQVHANNSIGEMYESDIRYFTIDYYPIEIISPENITYTGPMSGYYPATYGFEPEDVGSDPNEWTIDEGTTGTINVIGGINGHKKVVEFHDSGSDDVLMSQYFTDGVQTSGTIEYWFMTTDSYGVHHMRFYENPTLGPDIAVWEGKLQFATTIWNEICTIENDRWYHFRIDFECGTGLYKGLSADTFYFYVNETRYGSYDFKTGVDDLDYISLFSQTTAANYYFYIDAIGYSWAPSYTVGDNLDEGLLVSFDLGFNPVWLGYSLDGLTNKTILGNTTIPFLSEGVHTIQVFGNNSIGTLYQSDIRYFSIDVNAPTSMISFTPYRVPDIVIRSTAFTITADDGLGSGISLIRYKINDLSWNTYIGSFNLSTYEYDVYNITYQAIDGVGHIESENMITVTLIPEPSQPGIPGYQLFVMIGVISIVSAILIRKKYK